MLAQSYSINKGKGLCHQNEHNIENSRFYFSIQHWVGRCSDALAVFYHLKGSEMLWDVEWRMWIESEAFCVTCYIFYKSVVHHRDNSRWKEQKMSYYCSIPSLCYPMDTPCLAGMASSLQFAAQPHSEQSSICLDLSKLGNSKGLACISAYISAEKMLILSTSLYCCHLWSELKNEQTCKILLIELYLCFTNINLNVLVF